MNYKGVPLFEENGRIALLVSPGYGAGWSTWGDERLAYDRRIVEFWLSHKDDKEFMQTVRQEGHIVSEQSRKIGLYDIPESPAHKEAAEFFKSIGYEDCPYMGGFAGICVRWVRPGELWRITEYDGAEHLENFNTAGFIAFGGEE